MTQQLPPQSQLPPDLAGQLAQLQMRQQLSQALLGESMKPIDPTRSSGRYIVPISPLEGFAKLASTALNAKTAADTTGEMSGLYDQANQRMSKALSSSLMGPSPQEQQSQQPSGAALGGGSGVVGGGAGYGATGSQAPGAASTLEAPTVEVTGKSSPTEQRMPTLQQYTQHLSKVATENNVSLQQLLANPVVQANLKQIEEYSKPQKLGEGEQFVGPNGVISEGKPKLTEFGRTLAEFNAGGLNGASIDAYKNKIAKDSGLKPENIHVDPNTGKAYGVVFENGVPSMKELGGDVQTRKLPEGIRIGPDGKEMIDPNYLDLKSQIAKAGKPEQTITVDARSYDKTAGAERAKLASARQEGAMKAQDFAGSVRVLADVLKGYGGGPLTQFQAGIGRYFPESEYGKIASIDDLTNSIRTKLATTVRASGSGATSDYEMKQYLAAIPGLSTTPNGREMMATIAERMAQREATASDVYGELASKGQVKLSEWRSQVRKQVGDLFSKEELAQITGRPTPEKSTTGNLTPDEQKELQELRKRFFK